MNSWRPAFGVSDQTAVLAVGPGGNGKSTLLDAVVAALGKDNVSGLSLQRLESDKFAVVRLLGKLANVCADLPSDHLTSASTFKALTGGDRLTAERKFQGSFEFTPFCRLIFSTNHYPQSKDSSQAFFRRWYVVSFEAVLEPGEIIPDLAGQLANSKELSGALTGALNRAIALLPNMMARGGLSQNETTRTAKMEFQQMTDPLAAWVDRYTVLTPEGMVTKKDLFLAYNGAAEVAGRPPISPKALYAGVKRLRPTIQEAQRSVRGSVHWVFLGLELGASTSQDSRHSHDFFQISLACQKEREKEEKTLNRGNAVNGVNRNFLAEEVLSDDR